jgi:threonine synthase
MMTTPQEANVHAVAIEGTFDDCQALVKGMFNHHAFRDRVQLAGVNSINWARIVAQLTYYFVAGVALGAPSRPVSFSVPTGNFGDIFAGYVAKRMGLPIERLVIASNSNDILPRAVASGAYATRDVAATSSPSMDIQVSSNFERYLFEACGRNAATIRAQMRALAEKGQFEVGATLDRLRQDFGAAAASEDDVADAIRRVKASSGYLLDPHTACGVIAGERVLSAGSTPQVVLATAHPAKFPETIQAIARERPALPPRLASLMTDRERCTVLPNNRVTVEEFIEGRARSVQGEVA